ncbi:MAG TPA: methionine adenosyltransferase [Bacteroidetes bacterium]|nr:methionine adenosyltransferase [Bacteroidota bacterium]HRR10161.1 methionine adenosyltransferase [Rhodothermales bacterium]
MAYLFTSESVSEGHPDKVADQISDAILDALLEQDPKSRVAVETLVTTGLVVLSGEVTTNAYVDVQEVARQVIRKIGYTDPLLRFDAESCGVISSIHAQSPDIAQGVDEGVGLHEEQGAGDQGMMFGFACTETPEYMPMSIQFSHRLVQELARIRKETNWMPYLRPDAKSQVTIEYTNDRSKPLRVHTIVLSTQHDEEVSQEQIASDVRKYVIPAVIPAVMLDDQLILHVNPTGRFVIGGPHGDTGLTGRKIIVDTYGGWGAHGGGAFSGKDPSKVDRSAAYAARHVAKNLVAAGLAEQALVQVAYAIGVADPVSVNVNAYGTGKYSDVVLGELVTEVFDLRPSAIIQRLDLLKPGYQQTAAYGHFGREMFSWEQLNYVDALKAAAAKRAGVPQN